MTINFQKSYTTDGKVVHLSKDEEININTKDPEFSTWRWSQHNLLVENIVPFKRDVYSKILDEFKNIF